MVLPPMPALITARTVGLLLRIGVSAAVGVNNAEREPIEFAREQL